MTAVDRYDVVDYGVDHAQYFTCSAAFSGYDLVFIGAWEDAHGALEDALDQAASIGYDVSHIPNDLSEDVTVPETEEGEDSELYHYVALFLSPVTQQSDAVLVDGNQP